MQYSLLFVLLQLQSLTVAQDNVWSSQQQEQIIGRIHRQPQMEECHVYIPRLAGSSDMALRHKVTVKEKLLELFVGK